MAVEELFVRFGSLVVELTVAVLDVSEPDPVSIVAFTLIVMITKPPTLTDPSVQVTVVVPLCSFPARQESKPN